MYQDTLSVLAQWYSGGITAAEGTCETDGSTRRTKPNGPRLPWCAAAAGCGSRPPIEAAAVESLFGGSAEEGRFGWELPEDGPLLAATVVVYKRHMRRM